MGNIKPKAFRYTGEDNLDAMRFAKNYNRYLLKLFTSHVCDKNALILDFGAGTGTFADLLSQDGYKQIECVEADQDLAKKLKSKGYATNTSLSNIKHKYDAIYLYNVLEHIDKDSQVIGAILDYLKPGGKLIVYVPAFQHLFSAMDKKVGHYRRYTLKSLSKACENNTTIRRHLGYHDPMGYVASLVYKLVGNREGDLSSSKVRIFDNYIFPLGLFIQPVTSRLFGKNVLLVVEKVKK